MNLISRTLTKGVSSSLYHSKAAKLTTQKWVISQQIRVFSATVIRSGARKKRDMASVKPPLNVAAEKELTPPKKIEYNLEEISNCIKLTGFVELPVQSCHSSDGKFWAGTVISQRSDSKSSNLRIPIIFEDDLAHIAVQDVQKEDRIHVSGKLFVESPPHVTYSHSIVQVLVRTLNFVQAASSPTKTISPPEKEVISTEKQHARSKKVKVIDEETSNSWKHLIENPKEWLDHSGNKANGLVKPGHPDFKRKVGGFSLWLNTAPDWALLKLKELEFDVLVPKANLKQLKREESWNNLVQNPSKWWDNRLDKRNRKGPHFKHKVTGEALWINNSPSWALSKLPPLKKN